MKDKVLRFLLTGSIAVGFCSRTSIKRFCYRSAFCTLWKFNSPGKWAWYEFRVLSDKSSDKYFYEKLVLSLGWSKRLSSSFLFIFFAIRIFQEEECYDTVFRYGLTKKKNLYRNARNWSRQLYRRLRRRRWRRWSLHYGSINQSMTPQ